jgi:acyl transferase domain-containing protein
MCLDAACASTLMALAYAAESLQSGRIDMAVVGGASYCDFEGLVLFSQSQAASNTGSRPFDEEADGLVAAEGYVMLVVKTLERAMADGDPIQAVIRGIGIASDGRGKSLWAPRREGQIEAFRRAYRGGLEPSWLQYLEGHATSTQIGDATEVNALSEVLLEYLPPGKKIPLGAVKANIGHTLETAGMAGLVKTVLALQRRTIPPVINVRKLNSAIDWDKSPFFVPTTALPWPEPPAGQPRRAGVNAFGIGGLNAHVVLDDHVPPASTRVRGVELPAVRPPRQGDDDQAIAVIGASALVPGALTLDAFWELLTSGRDPKSEAPRQR